jgi:hypothetical protein
VEWVVELDIIGFVNPVGIKVTALEDATEEEVIALAFETLTLVDDSDASFVGIKEIG